MFAKTVADIPPGTAVRIMRVYDAALMPNFNVPWNATMTQYVGKPWIYIVSSSNKNSVRLITRPVAGGTIKDIADAEIPLVANADGTKSMQDFYWPVQCFEVVQSFYDKDTLPYIGFLKGKAITKQSTLGKAAIGLLDYVPHMLVDQIADQANLPFSIYKLVGKGTVNDLKKIVNQENEFIQAVNKHGG